MTAANPEVKVVLVEDDPLQAELFGDVLTRGLLGVRVERIPTESAFRESLGQLATEPPNLFVMDMLIRWADPAPQMPIPPEDVKREGFFSAGARCLELIRKLPTLSNVPVIIFSILDEDDARRIIEGRPALRGVSFSIIPKSSDLSDFITEVHSRVGLAPPNR